MQFNKSSSPSGNSSLLQSYTPGLSGDPYTGRLQASLPLCELSSSDLNIPISLNYTAGSGVRISDLNTVVGMDWQLVAGGSISRTVRGIPDESDKGYIGPNSSNQYGAGNMGVKVVNAFNSKNGNQILFNNNENKRVLGIAPIDGEPDIFNVNTPTFSAQFTIDQNGNPVFSSNAGLKIIQNFYENSTLAGLNGITIIDDKGNQYIFGTQFSTREMTTTSFFGTSFNFISTWYLEKIILFNSKDVVTFSYLNGSDVAIYNYTLSMDFTSTFNSSATFPPPGSPISFANLDYNRPVSITTTTYNGPKYISQISTKLGEADFAYASPGNANIYTNNPPELTSITLKQFNPVQNANNITLKTYNFSYSEIETGVSGWTVPFPYAGLWSDYYRRLLNTVTLTGNTTATATPLTVYNLKYYQLLPYPNHELIQDCDYWGFPNTTAFNIDGSSAFGYYFTNPDQARLPTIYNPNGSTQEVPTAAVFGLQEVDNVTGGASTINYDLNTVYNGSYNVQVGGTRVSSITQTFSSAQPLTTTYIYDDANGHSTGQLWSDLYSRVTMNFGTSCCNFSTLGFSQSPYGISDDQGVIVGYSAVKVIRPSGGYEIHNFTNFSDYPDVITEPPAFAAASSSAAWSNTTLCLQLSSFSYKRGLEKSVAQYKANGDLVSQTTNTYASLDGQPTVTGIGIQDMTWWLNNGAFLESVNVYNSNFENWQLTQTVKKDYDQLTPSNYLQTTTSYTYCPDKRQIQSITITDSKGQTTVKTFYHSNDASIPFVAGNEPAAISAMLSANCSSALIHQTESRNGSVRQTHHTFTAFPVSYATSVFETAKTDYVGSTQTSQQVYNYDASDAQLISSNLSGGRPTGVSYAYNASYPVAKVVNATNTASVTNQQTTVTGNLYVPGGSYSPQFATFTTVATGTITISMPANDYLFGPNGVTVLMTVYLSGPSNQSGVLCQNSTSGYTCSYPTILSFPNMPAGTYSITVDPDNNNAQTSSSIPINYSYTGYQLIPSGLSEFYFEGFEQNPYATAGGAHTGNMYYNNSFTVPFVMPNSRSYLIQWWSLSGGKWVFNQQPYTNNMVVTGPVDDIRVFPADAQMTTYTYSPMVGKTSETDPSGKTQVFEYDGLGRLQDVRDQDGNIIKTLNYHYIGQ